MILFYEKRQENEKKKIIIEGKNINNILEFYDGIEKVLTKNLTWKIGRNLNAFNDILCGGFGVLEDEEIILIWKNSENSKEKPGDDDFCKCTKQYDRQRSTTK